MTKRLLLTSVFGPYGVDDTYGRKENIMELYHNQVTKAQGVLSPRYHHRSFGLYFLAYNVESPVTVLDFPTLRQFVRLLQRERFDAVGISFILPNFVKAREMARLVRKHQPWAEIILGGHGAAIESLETLIDCDHIVRGEGIRWLRSYLGENPDRPILHPTLSSTERKRIAGIPDSSVCGLLVPGVGCVNGCRFCATTHFFGKSYQPFFRTGQELYQLASRISRELGSGDFFVMDENFLKDRQRALELLELMETNSTPFQFDIFSSAEAIEQFGVENMARLGIGFVWIGAESKRETYQKNSGRDLKQLIRNLRDHGISVLASGILFLEHHTPDNIQQDIDFMLELEPDLTQFMMFTALPTTTLYQQYKAKDLIDFELPWEEWHGQHVLNFRHPAFTASQSTAILQDAFQQEYDRHSSSVYRIADTVLRGYRTLSRLAEQDAWMALRRDQLASRAKRLRLILPTVRRFAHDSLARQRAEHLMGEYERTFGPMDPRSRLLSLGARVLAEAHTVRTRLFGDMPQPRQILTRYRWPEGRARPVPLLTAAKPGCAVTA
jgi:radical SAM superfamily enzyme YgiQ (UPF0313 family)